MFICVVKFNLDDIAKLKLVEVLCATRQYCFLPSFLSFFLFLLSYAATDLCAYTLQHNQPRDMAPFGGSQSW